MKHSYSRPTTDFLDYDNNGLYYVTTTRLWNMGGDLRGRGVGPPKFEVRDGPYLRPLNIWKNVRFIFYH